MWIETPTEGNNKQKTFTDEEVLDELKDILYGAKDRVNFRFKHWSDKVEVYIGESIAYVINRSLYFKLMDDA